MVLDLLALPVGAGRMAAWRVRLLCWGAGRPLLVPPQQHGPSRTTDKIGNNAALPLEEVVGPSAKYR